MSELRIQAGRPLSSPEVNSLPLKSAAALGTVAVPGSAPPLANGAAPAPLQEVEIGLGPSLDPHSPLYDSCHYVVSSPGKKFRARIVEAAAQYGSHAGAPAVEQAAVAIELFHAATLAHDDVVDDGQLRRGRATIGAHAGNFAASLAGGWLFARAIELFADAGDEPVSEFARTAAVVCQGEMLEVRCLYDTERSRDGYLEVIQAKTASLIAFASWVGGYLGGAGQEEVARLERYGEAVGMAFQIADDILDLIADAELTGKTPGSDLRQGVYTLPTIYALEEDRFLAEALRAGPEQDEVPHLVERIRASGAIDAALAECDSWVEEAIAALPGTEHAARERLASLAEGVRRRLSEMAAP